MAHWPPLTWFEPLEFDHPERMSRDLLLRLDRARQAARIPFRINSSWRAMQPHEEHSAKQGHYSYHWDGRAVDIACLSAVDRARIVKALLDVGLSVGVYQSHVHADNRPRQILFHGTYSDEVQSS